MSKQKTKKEIREKLVKKIMKYNNKAIDWGYTTVHLDDDDEKLRGTFTPHTMYENASGFKGLYKGGIEAYRNGYLEGDFKKIQELFAIYDKM